jgi:hypothetical protein
MSSEPGSQTVRHGNASIEDSIPDHSVFCRARHERREAIEFPNPDFAALARACGGYGFQGKASR